MGSNKSNPFYTLWSELMDMESVEFVSHDVWVDIETAVHADRNGSKIFHLYTNILRLEKYLLNIATEDAVQIKKLISSMRKIQQYEIPPEIKTLPKYYSLKQKIGSIKHLPLLFFMLRSRYMTNFTFAEKLKNPFLKEAFQLLFDGEEVPLVIFTIPLSIADSKGTGYPVGGSLRFAKRIEERYLSLGGKINYNSGIKEIMVKDNIARGVILENGKEIISDITVSTADWYFTVFKALKGKFVNNKLLNLREGKCFEVYYSVINVSLGISRSLNHLSHFTRFPVPRDLVSPDGTVYKRVELHVYNYDPTLAPEGKTSVSASFYTKNGEYWIALRQTDHRQYKLVKEAFAKTVIDLLDEKVGGIKDFVEEIDVATPATFNRYTHNWKGSVQGWLPGRNIMASSPVGFELPGLKNFYYASHWSLPGGGLPSAIKTSSDLAQVISKVHRSRKIKRT
jgi:phytoene dehydrogenase-like protein